MKIIPKFKGRIKNGNLSLFDKDKFSRYLVKFEGKDIWCSVDLYKKIGFRSIQQNRYLWGVCYKMIAFETGHSEEEIHEIMKGMFNSEITDFRGKKIKVNKSTTSLDKLEFMEYWENIKNWASMELNIIIPDPDEYLN